MAREDMETNDPKPAEFRLTKKQSARMRQLGADRAAVDDVLMSALNAAFKANSRIKELEAEAWEEVLEGHERGWDWTIERTGKPRLIARPIRRITPTL